MTRYEIGLCLSVDVTKSTKTPMTCKNNCESKKDIYIPTSNCLHNYIPIYDGRKFVSGANKLHDNVGDTEINKLCSIIDSIEIEDNVELGNDCCVGETIDSIHFTKVTPRYIFRQDEDGDTQLHMAIILKHESIAMYCIGEAQQSSWLSIKNDLFQSPLHLAALLNQCSVARRLVVGGAELELRDKDGNTPLHIACRDGLYDIAQALLEPVRYPEAKQNLYEIPYRRIPQDFTIANYDGYTCLHLAAMNGHIGIVQILLEKGIDINLKEAKTGRTILHNACLSGDMELVKLLLQHKHCNVNATAYDERTPLDIARCRRNYKICTEIAAAGACYSGCAEEDQG